MITNVSDRLAAISSLEYQLSNQIDEVMRAQEMVMRLACTDLEQTVPENILDYMCGYSAICREALAEETTEGFSVTISSKESKGGGIIKRIFVAIKNAIVKVFETIKNIFKYLFDAQYRHRKQFVDINRDLMRLAASPSAVARFEAIPCAVLKQSDALDVLEKSSALVNFIRLCSGCTSNDGIDGLFRQFQGIGGVTFQDDKAVDNNIVLRSEKFNSLKEAGWTVEGLQKVIKKQIDVISGVETLKETQSNFERDVRKLEREVDAMMNKNASSEEIQMSQKRIALLIRITKIIAGSIVVLTSRTKAITNIVRGISDEAMKVMQEAKM